MKTPSIGALAFGAVGVVALVLVAIGPPGSRPAHPDLTAESAPPPPAGVSAGGFTLTSASVELPTDDPQYPDGPNADVINANCTSCHSASMGLTQPPQSADQWTATVTKMREIYHAPVPAKDVPAIVAYLTAMSAQQAGPATGRAQDPDPKAAPDVSGSTG